MNRRTDIIVYAICLLLLVGAACFWWQGVFPSSGKELVLLPGESASARQNDETGGSNHYGNSPEDSNMGVQDIADGSYGFELDNFLGQDYRGSGQSDVRHATPDRPGQERNNRKQIFVHVAGAVKSPGYTGCGKAKGSTRPWNLLFLLKMQMLIT